MSWFDQQVRSGLDDAKAVAGRTVTYRRGERSIELTAIAGRTMTEVGTLQGMRHREGRRAYLIDAADLDLGSGPTEPSAGDEIVDGDQVWEVTTLEGAERPWTWSDPAHTRYRVHAIRLGWS